MSTHSSLSDWTTTAAIEATPPTTKRLICWMPEGRFLPWPPFPYLSRLHVHHLLRRHTHWDFSPLLVDGGVLGVDKSRAQIYSLSVRGVWLFHPSDWHRNSSSVAPSFRFDCYLEIPSPLKSKWINKGHGTEWGWVGNRMREIPKWER